MDHGRFTNCYNVSISQWSQMWHGGVDQVAGDLFIAAECGSLAVTRKKAEIPYLTTRLTLFPSRRSELVKQSTSTVERHYIAAWFGRSRREGYMETVACRLLFRRSLNVQDVFQTRWKTRMDGINWGQKVSCCATKYIDDARNRFWYRSIVKGRGSEPRRNNVVFKPAFCSINPQGCANRKVLALKAQQNVAVEEQFYEDFAESSTLAA